MARSGALHPIAELYNLQETDGITEYHKRFVLICTKVTLPESYLVRLYLAGLQSDTQLNVRMFQPQTLRQCLMIGKLYESVHPCKPKRANEEFLQLHKHEFQASFSGIENGEPSKISVELPINLDDDVNSCADLVISASFSTNCNEPLSGKQFIRDFEVSIEEKPCSRCVPSVPSELPQPKVENNCVATLDEHQLNIKPKLLPSMNEASVPSIFSAKTVLEDALGEEMKVATSVQALHKNFHEIKEPIHPDQSTSETVTVISAFFIEDLKFMAKYEDLRKIVLELTYSTGIERVVSEMSLMFGSRNDLSESGGIHIGVANETSVNTLEISSALQVFDKMSIRGTQTTVLGMLIFDPGIIGKCGSFGSLDGFVCLASRSTLLSSGVENSITPIMGQWWQWDPGGVDTFVTFVVCWGCTVLMFGKVFIKVIHDLLATSC